MKRILHGIPGIILLALVLAIPVASAADGMNADLNVSKVVSSAGPNQINDVVTWAITLRNDGPANATKITLSDTISPLTGLGQVTAVAGIGEYNTTTNIWSIGELKNATTATLTLKTNFSTAGTRTNRINITGLDETDPVVDNNMAEAEVHINASGPIINDQPLASKLVIRPTTLNLKSKGVFTVYVTLTGTGFRPAGHWSKTPGIDYANSSLACNGADLVRTTASDKEGRTLIAKFHRADLENVTTGDGVKVTCSGMLAVNGTTIPVEGNATIRVIGKNTGENTRIDNFLSRLMKFLGLNKDDVEIIQGEDGNYTVTLSLDPDNFKNPGKVKKMLNTWDNETLLVTGNKNRLFNQTCDDIKNSTKTSGDDNQIQKQNIENKPDKGNKHSFSPGDKSPGKSNGKGNT
ncbi:MAG TPA: DUF11 domain-containing protein [Methanoregula sp.]|nr:DUF11 domain-containing protein [Methanoregula sp.]